MQSSTSGSQLHPGSPATVRRADARVPYRLNTLRENIQSKPNVNNRLLFPPSPHREAKANIKTTSHIMPSQLTGLNSSNLFLSDKNTTLRSALQLYFLNCIILTHTISKINIMLIERDLVAPLSMPLNQKYLLCTEVTSF